MISVAFAEKLSLILFSLVFGFLLSFIFTSKAEAASMKLNPDVVTTESGEKFSVDIFLDAQGAQTDGADVVLKYDPNQLEVVNVEEGEIYPKYPIKQIEEEFVKITGISNKSGPFFSSSGVFATVTFKAKFGGEHMIKIDFNNESTIDSNVAAHGKGIDILSEVGDSILYIGGESSANLISRTTVGTILMVLVYIIIMVIIAYFAYKWYRKRQKGEDIFIPEVAPLDRPPDSAG